MSQRTIGADRVCLTVRSRVCGGLSPSYSEVWRSAVSSECVGGECDCEVVAVSKGIRVRKSWSRERCGKSLSSAKELAPRMSL